MSVAGGRDMADVQGPPRPAGTADSTYMLLSDLPSMAGPDPLGYEQVAAGLAAALKVSKGSTPFVLGIEGEWGSGKSSIMYRLMAELDATPGIETVWFNAWTAERSSALEGLIKAVLNQLDTNAVRRALRNQQLVSWVRALGLLVGGFLRVSRVVDLAWTLVNVDARARNELRGLMTEAVVSWRQGPREIPSDRMIVVFVDDLDRASPAQVFEVFEALKLYLDVPGLAFVIGYDIKVLSRIILDGGHSGPTFRALDYLEKIVQASYRISVPNDDRVTTLFDHFSDLSRTRDLFDVAAARLVIERSGRNPRRIKRFINSFVLLYSLDRQWERLGARNLVSALVLEAHFPEFAALWRQPTGVDPVVEFLEYHRTKRELLAERDADSAAQGVLALEEALPDCYPVLYEDDRFVAILQSMRQAVEWPEISKKLRVGGDDIMEVVGPGSLDFADTYREPGAVLWLDEQPDLNRAAIDTLTRSGWHVVVARDERAADRLLTSRRYDGIVACVDQYVAADGGLGYVANLRDRHGHQGPLIFFTLRVTPKRKAQATELRGIITNRIDDILRELDQ